MNDLMARPINEAPLAVLDTETTGLSPDRGDRIVEVAAVRVAAGGHRPWQIEHSFSRLVNPGRPMDPGASRVNGIYDDDLRDAPAFGAVAEELLALLDGAVLVAHNARFDAGFLGMELARLNQQTGDNDSPPLPNPWICTMLLARRHFHFGGNSLGQVARRLGVRSGRAHRALSDVHTTLAILQRMAVELAGRGLETVGDLLHAQGGAIFVPRPQPADLPPEVDRALNSRLLLRIRYQSLSGITERVIQPLTTSQSRGVVYLVAYCHLRQDQRTFRLDRILSAEIIS